MSTAITQSKPNTQPQRPSALALMASRLSVDPGKMLATLKGTVFQKASEEEMLALVVVANEYGLNPFLKELYAFPAKGGGIVPIVSVDGWNKMLNRHPDFDGIEFDFAEDGEGNLVSCTATVYLKNRSHPVKITEYLAECKRNTDPWNNMPRRMLRNRTLCQAARVAFGFSGVYHEDEAATITVDSTVVPSEPPPKIVAAPTAEKSLTPQQEVQGYTLAEGFTLDHALKAGHEIGHIKDPTSIGSFDEIPTDVCKLFLRAKSGFKSAMAKIKEGEELP